MAFDLNVWKECAAERVRDIGDLLKRATSGAPYVVYGALCTLSLWPLVEAAQKGKMRQIMNTLSEVADNEGGDLIANQDASVDQAFKYANHPRERVSWYDAVAFCRWLSDKLGTEVSLPSEQQWEKVARGWDGRVYPWGNEYIPGYANINETVGNSGPNNLQMTSAVGMYPQGASPSPYHVMDMSGNVWEWCQNEYDKPSHIQLAGNETRVLRGGRGSILDVTCAARTATGIRPPIGTTTSVFCGISVAQKQDGCPVCVRAAPRCQRIAHVGDLLFERCRVRRQQEHRRLAPGCRRRKGRHLPVEYLDRSWLSGHCNWLRRFERCARISFFNSSSRPVVSTCCTNARDLPALVSPRRFSSSMPISKHSPSMLLMVK